MSACTFFGHKDCPKTKFDYGKEGLNFLRRHTRQFWCACVSCTLLHTSGLPSNQDISGVRIYAKRQLFDSWQHITGRSWACPSAIRDLLAQQVDDRPLWLRNCLYNSQLRRRSEICRWSETERQDGYQFVKYTILLLVWCNNYMYTLHFCEQ